MDDRVAHLAQLAIRRAQRGRAEPAAAAAAVVTAILRRVYGGENVCEKTGEEVVSGKEVTSATGRRSSARDIECFLVARMGWIGGSRRGGISRSTARGVSQKAARRGSYGPRTPCLWRLPPL